jgi:hypothetical protein
MLPIELGEQRGYVWHKISDEMMNIRHAAAKAKETDSKGVAVMLET